MFGVVDCSSGPFSSHYFDELPPLFPEDVLNVCSFGASLLGFDDEASFVVREPFATIPASVVPELMTKSKRETRREKRQELRSMGDGELMTGIFCPARFHCTATSVYDFRYL